MPRDSSGNYTLPAGNPVVTGATVSSSWANTTLTDIASVLTASLDRSGNGGMLTGFKITDGTAGAPGLTFTSEPTTGIWRTAANSIGISIGGTNQITLTPTVLSTRAQNVSFGTPTGGVCLTLSALTGQYGLQINGASFAGATLVASGGAFGTNDTYLFSQAATFDGVLGTRGATILHLQTNSVDRITVAATGGVTIAQPTSGGVTLSVTAPPAGFGGIFATTSVTLAPLVASCGGSGIAMEFQDGTNNAATVSFAANHDLQINGGAFGLNLFAGNLSALQINSSRQVVIAAPGSGVAFYVNSVAGTHSTQIEDSAGNNFNAGYLEVPEITTSVNRVCILSDSGKAIYCNNAGLTLTIPSNASVPYPVGTVLTFINLAAGSSTIAITTDTLTWLGTGAAGSRTLAQYGRAVAQKVGVTTWIISGVNLT